MGVYGCHVRGCAGYGEWSIGGHTWCQAHARHARAILRREQHDTDSKTSAEGPGRDETA